MMKNNKMVEIKPHPTFKDYLISSKGDVFSKKYSEVRFRKPSFNHQGYLQIVLSENNKSICHRVSRLVAQTFIPNPYNKPCVNHKNGEKADNQVKNLEWCTYSENAIHSINVLGNKPYKLPIMKGINHARCRKVKQIDIKTGNIIKVWDYINKAAKELGMHHSAIIGVCRKRRKSAGGFYWKYVNELEEKR